jgi:hypothetical protein
MQRALEHIQLNALQLQALEARLVVVKKVRVADIRAAELIIDDMATQSDKLAGQQRARDTVLAVGALSSAFGRLVPPVAEQDPRLIHPAVYNARYLPARLRLQHVASVGDREAEARVGTAQREFAIGTIVSLLAAVLLSGALAWRVNRVRAREIGTVRKAERGRLRRLIAGLAPQELDRAGLASAIHSALSATKEEFGIDFELVSELEIEPGSEARTIAYRILQEALANARKHARPSRLEVVLRSEEGGVLASLTDNGEGFDVDVALAQIRPGHLGLAAMRERAALAGGWLTVNSGPGGTTVRFWVPDRAGVDAEPKAEAV